MGTLSRQQELGQLHPEHDAERIAYLIACFEFPWDTTRSLEIALFRTFCAPEISALLQQTGEFRRRAQRRYDDTDLLVSELLEHGYRSERGRRALRRINQQHHRFAIGNREFLYVLSTFIFEPIRWNQRFGWRPMTETERLGWFHFWRGVGQGMGIREIPASYAEFERFNCAYEAAHFRYADANAEVGEAVLAMFCGWFPRPLSPWVRAAILALLPAPVITAFGFPPPSPRFTAGVLRMLSARAWLLRYLPKRRRPRLRTAARHRSYPGPYTIERLGPPGT